MKFVFFKKIIGVLGIGVLICTGVYFMLMHEDNQSKTVVPEIVSRMSVAEETAYWEGQIDAKGGFEAYKDFTKIYAAQPYEIQHTHAHVFGEALYKIEGIEGIAVCDSSFGFGCFHSFFGWAMIANGTGITKQLDDACVAAYGEKGLGCPHGIGHGVMVELGNEDLNEALEICSSLNWQKPIGGCTSGVFMEYNQNTMGDGSLRTPTEDWHFPCNAVADRFTQACYFEQTTWWSGVSEEDFNFIGERCNEVTAQADREACFRGAGHTSASVFSFDFERMRLACSQMPNEESELLCVEGATWLTAWEPRFKDTWQQMCNGFTGKAYESCLDSKNFI